MNAPVNSWRLEVADHICLRCGGPLQLRLTVPYHHPETGCPSIRPVPLCPSCDRDDPAAAGLLAFFTLHEQITLDNADEFVALADAWAARLPPLSTGVDLDTLDAQIAAWRAGQYDDDPGSTKPEDEVEQIVGQISTEDVRGRLRQLLAANGYVHPDDVPESVIHSDDDGPAVDPAA